MSDSDEGGAAAKGNLLQREQRVLKNLLILI